MLEKLNLEHILFLDVETVPEFENFNELTPVKQKLWEQKSAYKRKYDAEEGEEISAEDYYKNAGIWSEFGKVVCISVGFFNVSNAGNTTEFRVKSFYNDNEEIVLKAFSDLLDNYYNGPQNLLCGHNIKEFDVPYLARRILIKGIKMPKKLNLFGKKPWETPLLDTLELWKFGDYKHYTSLKLLTEILGIASPKDDIDGSQVRSVYYEGKDLIRIADYCEKDVIAVAQVVLRFSNKPLLNPDEIVHLD
jgi:DNA polymerase elongation subunit (family B)